MVLRSLDRTEAPKREESHRPMTRRVTEISCCARTMTRTICPQVFEVFSGLRPLFAPGIFLSQLTSLVASTFAPCAKIALSNCDTTSILNARWKQQGLNIKSENSPVCRFVQEYGQLALPAYAKCCPLSLDSAKTDIQHIVGTIVPSAGGKIYLFLFYIHHPAPKPPKSPAQTARLTSTWKKRSLKMLDLAFSIAFWSGYNHR